MGGGGGNEPPREEMETRGREVLLPALQLPVVGLETERCVNMVAGGAIQLQEAYD
jgi:hypothetical protein